MHLRLPSTALAVVVALVVSGCGSSDDESSSSSQVTTSAAATPQTQARPAVQSATVDIRSFKFKPVDVTVKKGGRVRWTNADGAAHTATADARSFDTQTIDEGEARTVTMTRAGSFPYHCDFHPFMKGTVVVR
jgi:plastocyanin